MTSLTLYLCTYCAIIGIALWITLFVTLHQIVHGWKNRYNLSHPMVVIYKVAKKHSIEETGSLIVDDKMNSTVIDNIKASELEGMMV